MTTATRQPSAYYRHPKLWRRIYPVLSRIDHVPGCYAIYIRGELVYLGQSVNLHLRFRRHGICRRAGGFWLTPWGKVHILHLAVKIAYSKKYGDWVMRELRLVRRLEPRFNTIMYAGKESAHG